jgi:iron complex outermembrane receptor protein
MLSVVLVLALAAPPGAAPACTLHVEGRVVDGTTGEHVPGARVQIGERAPLLTDDVGRYRIDGVCPGAQSITVERADYQSARRSVRLVADASVDFALEPHEIERIDDVVVEAPAPSRSEMRASTTLDADDLDRTRGRNLADSIAKIPGVAVLRTGGGGMGKPIIRGQDERRNLILFDRVRHAGQKWGVDHAPEIDPFAAGSITVIKGAGGIRWGPDAIGGVVLVDPLPLRRTPGIAGRAHLVGVSNGKRGAVALGLDGAHRRLPGFAWRLEGNVTRGAAVITPLYPLDNTGTLQWNVGTTLGYLSDAFDVQLSWRRNDNRSGLCTCLRNDSPDDFLQSFELGRPVNSDLYSREYRIERAFQHTVHDLAIARTRVAIGDAGDLTATYSLQNNDRREYAIVRTGVTGPQYRFDLRTHAGDLVFERAASPLGDDIDAYGTYGAAVQHQTNRYDANLTLIPDYTQTMGGVFAIERLVWRRVEFEVGASYEGMHREAALTERDYAAQTGTGRLQAARCTPTPANGGRCGFDFHTGSASLGALLRPVPSVPSFEMKLDLASAGRFPAIDEQFLNGTAPSFPILGIGDSRIGVERTWGSSLTLSYANDWLATDGSAYANYIDDYIYFAPQPSDGPLGVNETVHGTYPVFAFRPVGALFYGGEYGFRVAPPKWPVELDAQLAIVRARDVRNDAYLVFIPPDRYQLGLTYRWPDVGRMHDGFVGVTGGYVDRQRRFDLDADFVAPPPGYAQLGAQAGVSIALGDQTLKFALAGTNLTNTRYRDYTSLLRYFADEPGWELLLRISLEFGAGPPSTRSNAASTRGPRGTKT